MWANFVAFVATVTEIYFTNYQEKTNAISALHMF